MIKTALLILLYILLGILLLILIADFTVKVSMENGVTAVSVGVWPILIRILPAKPKPEAEKQPAKPKKGKKSAAKKKKAVAEAEEKAKKSPGDIKALLEIVLALVKAVLPPVGYILRGLRFRHLTLHIKVGEGDAAQTAIRYGQLNAALYTSLPLAQAVFDLKTDHVGVSYDYLAAGTEMIFSVEVHLRGARVIWGVLKMIGRALPALLRTALRKPKK